jgi:hypothetical protein
MLRDCHEFGACLIRGPLKRYGLAASQKMSGHDAE